MGREDEAGLELEEMFVDGTDDGGGGGGEG